MCEITYDAKTFILRTKGGKIHETSSNVCTRTGETMQVECFIMYPSVHDITGVTLSTPRYSIFASDDDTNFEFVCFASDGSISSVSQMGKRVLLFGIDDSIIVCDEGDENEWGHRDVYVDGQRVATTRASLASNLVNGTLRRNAQGDYETVVQGQVDAYVDGARVATTLAHLEQSVKEGTLRKNARGDYESVVTAV